MKKLVLILGAFLIFLLIPTIHFLVSAALVYLLMNLLLPILGAVYPLTVLQCFVASVVIYIVTVFIRGAIVR